MSAIFERQNDEVAMTYLRAAKYCDTQKALVTYFMISISLLVTVASIAIRMFEMTEIQYENISTVVVIISGIVLIVNMFCSFLEYEFSIQGVNLMEWYDIYVFNMPVNKALMRPVGEQQIVNYARKYNGRKRVAALKNYYFKTPEEAEQKSAFMKIKNEFAYDHRLLLNVHALFMVMWVGYVVLVIGLAFLKEITFKVAAVNIFVPALSTITLIAGSWKRYKEQIRRVTNGVSVTTEMLSAHNKKDPSAVSLQSPLVLRQLQDALFSHRANAFLIPGILKRRFDKKLRHEEELLRQEVMNKTQLTSVKKAGRQRPANAAAESTTPASVRTTRGKAASPAVADLPETATTAGVAESRKSLNTAGATESRKAVTTAGATETRHTSTTAGVAKTRKTAGAAESRKTVTAAEATETVDSTGTRKPHPRTKKTT